MSDNLTLAEVAAMPAAVQTAIADTIGDVRSGRACKAHGLIRCIHGTACPRKPHYPSALELQHQRDEFSDANRVWVGGDIMAHTRDWTSRDAITNYHQGYDAELPFMRSRYDAQQDRIEWAIALEGGREIYAATADAWPPVWLARWPLERGRRPRCFCEGPWADIEPANRPETVLDREHVKGSVVNDIAKCQYAEETK